MMDAAKLSAAVLVVILTGVFFGSCVTCEVVKHGQYEETRREEARLCASSCPNDFRLERHPLRCTCDADPVE